MNVVSEVVTISVYYGALDRSLLFQKLTLDVQGDPTSPVDLV